jgi:hypothetical protein
MAARKKAVRAIVCGTRPRPRGAARDVARKTDTLQQRVDLHQGLLEVDRMLEAHARGQAPCDVSTREAMTKRMEWFHVECVRLSKALAQNMALLRESEARTSELQQMLGQAQAGIEMADLIKRMVHT